MFTLSLSLSLSLSLFISDVVVSVSDVIVDDDAVFQKRGKYELHGIARRKDGLHNLC